MLQFGSLVFNGTPRIAVPFRDDATPKSIEEAKSSGLDIAELRIDLFSNRGHEHVLHVISLFRGVPTLATIRSQAEGGEWEGTDDDRLALYSAIMPHADAADVELSSRKILDDVIRVAHHHNKPAIVSYHNFTETPTLEELQRTAKAARNRGADVVKIATHCAESADLRTLARLLLGQDDKPTVVIGMGIPGGATRVVFPVLGSLFTFAVYGTQTASGQLSLEDTVRFFRLLNHTQLAVKRS